MIKAGKWTITEEEFERQHAEATRRGKAALKTEIQAREVRYDQPTHRLVIELKNGATHIIPCELVQGLRDAAPQDIAAVELGQRGASLHWEKLDQDFTVGGLVRGIFGTKKWMEQLNRTRNKAKVSTRTSARPDARKPSAAPTVSPSSKRGRKAA